MPSFDPSEWNLDDSQETYAMPDGTEANLRILSVELRDRENDGTKYFIVRSEITEEPYSKEITSFLNIPSRLMDAKQLNLARNEMKKFTECFGLDMSMEFDPKEDWVGCEGTVILSLSKSDAYGEQNRIAKYLRSTR